jgi:hypothetical protein
MVPYCSDGHVVAGPASPSFGNERRTSSIGGLNCGLLVVEGQAFPEAGVRHVLTLHGDIPV